jgi:thiol-disulfide isomerase/thioredoxin
MLTGAAGPAKAAAPQPAPWPGNTRVIESQLSVEAAKRASQISLPQLRIYDGQGRRVSSRTGYSSDFTEDLQRIFKGESDPDASHPLSEDLATVVTADGKPIAVGRADFTLVKYWADWCVPCHAQTADLKKLLAAYPKLTFNLVHVDADRGKLLSGGKPVVRIELDAATRKKLEDPNLTPAQRQKLLEELMAAKAKGKGSE